MLNKPMEMSGDVVVRPQPPKLKYSTELPNQCSIKPVPFIDGEKTWIIYYLEPQLPPLGGSLMFPVYAIRYDGFGNTGIYPHLPKVDDRSLQDTWYPRAEWPEHRENVPMISFSEIETKCFEWIANRTLQKRKDDITQKNGLRSPRR